MWKVFALIAVGLGALGLASPAGAAEAPVATIGPRTITRAEVERRVRPRLIELENDRYEALRDGLEEMIDEELIQQEAKARGVSAEVLLRQEVEEKAAAPTEAEIQKTYNENKDDYEGKTLEQARSQVIEDSKETKTDERRAQFLAELRKKYSPKVSLKPPVVAVETAGRPARGGAKAPVTIIEFSDYQCPFCKRAEGVVDQVMQTYGDKVRVVFRNYPLPFHQHARGAAEAASCANAQGKFWEYHRKLFSSQNALAEDKLKAYAGELGLDQAKFDTCLATKPFKAAIDKDVADGEKAGVSGTPAFFINGRMISGAQPFERFKEVIDEELTSKKTASAS
jgi:protein-disulfide isomerase